MPIGTVIRWLYPAKSPDFVRKFVEGLLTIGRQAIKSLATRLASGKKFDVVQAERPTNRRIAFGNRLENLGKVSTNAFQSTLNFGVLIQLVATGLKYRSDSC